MKEYKKIEIHSPMIHVTGIETEGCRQFLGIPYAKATRFRYALMIETYEGVGITPNGCFTTGSSGKI